MLSSDELAELIEGLAGLPYGGRRWTSARMRCSARGTPLPPGRTTN